ncbi:MEKHLA domain-containing protein [Candidatus Halocynthiibacter alkanivorans]|uniref:MEKHLA domain-containing protein n=1 Tax=Candidatus Halocynthiibacter alkanivorans TaxID=2267619 RepID=UPI000DF1D7A3|nr:MEKHLA domain-containing protein [Candidatus Halocynthiibacter alkanivorans]
MHVPSSDNDFGAPHAALLLSSFARVTGRPLIADATAQSLYQSSQIVLSHNGAEDPVLTYGNLAAQTLWEMCWADLTHLPSRLTAEPQHRETRAEMFEQMRRRGFIDNYAGIRISASGRRFRIHKAVIWPLINAAGVKFGEAATFSEYEYL